MLPVQFIAHSIEGAESVTESEDISEGDEGDTKSDNDWEDIWEEPTGDTGYQYSF